MRILIEGSADGYESTEEELKALIAIIEDCNSAAVTLRVISTNVNCTNANCTKVLEEYADKLNMPPLIGG